jgi:hypothetical protein
VRRLSIVFVLLITTTCGPIFATPQAPPRFTNYQYTLAIPTTPLAPNEQLHLMWEPRPAPDSTAVYAVQLCVGLFGPWETVAALKTAMSAAGPGPACPLKGAVATSETLRTTSNSGLRLATELVVPSAPGFYDIHQVSIDGEGTATSAMGASGIIEVRGR